MTVRDETAKTPDDRRRAVRRDEDRRLLRREREIEAARRVSEALFEHLTPDELVGKALQTALDVVNAESGSILLADRESRQLVFRHSLGVSRVKAGTAIPWDQGIAGDVFHSGRPVVIANVKADRRHFPGIDEQTGTPTRDMIVLPLKRWRGEPIGVLTCLNKRAGRLDDDDVALLAIVSAITAAAIEQARLHQEAKLAEVARLLGDIGHDIKNLLMPVVCGTGLLEGEVKELLASHTALTLDKAKASFQLCTEVIGMVRTSTQRILDHVKQIADCVKGLSAEPEFAPGSVRRVVESVFETVRWLATDKGIALKTEGLETLPAIRMDERRLFNAFYNLVNNAITEVPAGGSITVAGKHDPVRQCVWLRVVDTGCGMPPDVRDSLFTAQAKSRKAGGTGLGTKIIKDVIDVHGGAITVDSTLGVGTTFTLVLPIEPPASS
ncbi:GAF domain-containing sensor histidine kinase [Nitrospira moscoviensis]|uniref:histidine kinase n=1 Tax=Nitrospira moscoviensis TaxID=42253 RepID=A0A0K2GIF2_NITMO|nr:GAF domain-containing sensor histidine kinase [Nitrospira moscoviensis]ALA60725.1 putative Histidine kinase, contains GAF domain [Nitrospira moscoviensis]